MPVPSNFAAANTPRDPEGCLPPLLVNAADLPRLERLAERVMAAAPELADRFLAELSRAGIVESPNMPAGFAGVGSVVTYRDESNGREQVVKLVWPEDADIAEGRISVATPVGVALLGLSSGAQIGWRTRSDEERVLTVLAVASDAS